MATEYEAIEALRNKDHLIHKCGWFKSYMSRLSEDNEGNPLPWYTYSSIKFIEPRLSDDMDVFEFGAGHSTLWYQDRVNTVTSIDEKIPWIDRIRERANRGTVVLYREGNDYPRAIYEEGSKRFDIVVIDGEFRDKCAYHTLPALKPNGIVIWDNSGQNTGKHFTDNGFKRLDFCGLTPVCTYENCTTIFYRPDNCFNI